MACVLTPDHHVLVPSEMGKRWVYIGLHKLHLKLRAGLARQSRVPRSSVSLPPLSLSRERERKLHGAVSRLSLGLSLTRLQAWS